MIELIDNKIFIAASLFIGSFIIFKFLTRKNKDLIKLEVEYNEIINSDKHKVKGQYD
ncbi:MAG TPA: hypothetical protein VJG30_04880 [Candidatus Nanoarchaeia archaeon]|nr:hypothetical protein [Candidatus Nanoarchaeia archaeon]